MIWSIAPTSKLHGSNSGKVLACLKATSICHDKNTLALEPIASDDFAIVATIGPIAKDPFPMFNSTLPKASTYNTGPVIVNARRKAALALGNHIKRMLVRAPLDKVLLLKSKLENLYIELSNFVVDFSVLKGRIKTYLHGVSQYIDVWAEYARAITSEVQSQHLAFVGKRLIDANTLESEAMVQVHSLREDLARVEHKQSELRKSWSIWMCKHSNSGLQSRMVICKFIIERK